MIIDDLGLAILLTIALGIVFVSCPEGGLYTWIQRGLFHGSLSSESVRQHGCLRESA